MRIIDEDLRGRTIIASDGQVIGEIESIFIQSETWQVEKLHIKLSKDIADQLGAAHRLFRPGALEIPVTIIQSVGDTVLLSVPVESLREFLPSDQSAQVHH